ncbi:MAG: NADH-quinone oxidoreductase subunit L [Spirochaetes bacterium]|nr:MAG: NADH-quinone oxidoreductase subunit L [Spirochaetota bacterium]
MDYESLLVCAVSVPVAGAFLMPIIGRASKTLRNVLSLFLICVPLAASIALLPAVIAGKTVYITAAMPLGLNISLAADGLAVFMAIVSSFISAIIALYSFDYIDHYENQNEYYLMIVLFLGSMMGICYSANLIPLYIFWELTALSSWRLIGFFRDEAFVRRADKAFMTTVFGALLMLLGFIMIGQQAGSFELAVIKEKLLTQPVSPIAVGLIIAGILAKSATLPFHTWLPDAGVAPSPVTALLHAAVLVKIGVYAYVRLFVATMSPGEFWSIALPVIALASTLVSAGAALLETDIKRIIAYSTVSQIGFIFLGLSSGTAIGITGGLLYILMHGIAKAGLFLSAGIIEQKTHVRDITKLGGLMKTMPVTAVSFLLCSFSVMGIPPFGGFFSKYMVITGALAGGNTLIAIAFVACGFLTLVYLFRIFNAIFLKEAPSPEILVREGSGTMVFSVALLAVLSVAGGLLIKYPAEFGLETAKQIMGLVK